MYCVYWGQNGVRGVEAGWATVLRSRDLGFDSRFWRGCVTTHGASCSHALGPPHQVDVTGAINRAVLLCGWKGNRWSDIAETMSYRLVV